MNAAVILAAGSSQRMGDRGKKELLLLEEKPVIAHSVEAFLATGLFTTLLITHSPQGEGLIKEALQGFDGLHFTCGGSTRQESVLKSLEFLSENPGIKKEDRVLIHDGARPWVKPDLIRSVVNLLETREGVIPVEPSTSAMKQLDSEGKIVAHLDREKTWAAQTPQGFHFGSLLKAYRRAAQSNTLFIDDSQLWDHFIGPVWTVEGPSTNRKITYREDL